MPMAEGSFSRSTKKQTSTKRSTSGLFSISQASQKAVPRISTASALSLINSMHLSGFTTELKFGPSSTTRSLKRSPSSKRPLLKIFSNNSYQSRTLKRTSSRCSRITRKTRETRRKNRTKTRRLNPKIDFIDIL